jgi:hypothetical protein
MPKERSFAGVDQEAWDCLRTSTAREHGTVYTFDAADPSAGTATTKVAVIGDIVLRFKFDDVKDTITYTIQQKPLIVGDDQIWNGIQESIDHCNS